MLVVAILTLMLSIYYFSSRFVLLLLFTPFDATLMLSSMRQDAVVRRTPFQQVVKLVVAQHCACRVGIPFLTIDGVDPFSVDVTNPF